MTKQINKIPRLITLKELRDERRYRQKDIADGTGLSGAIVSRVMKDKDIGGLTYTSAKAFAKWLGVSMEELGQEESAEE